MLTHGQAYQRQKEINQQYRENKGQDEQKFWCKIVNIFFSISLNICVGCSKEPSHLDGSFEYPQYTFWLRNKIFCFNYERYYIQ